MIIKNVKVYTEDKTFVPGEVAVADGKFAAEAAADSEVLDGEGCYMIPGLVDIHFHGCIGDDFNEALLSAMIAVGNTIPKKNILVSSGAVKSKVDLLEPCRVLDAKGYTIYATQGTAKFLNENGIKATAVCWPDEQGDLDIMEMFSNHVFELVVNIPKDHSKRELTNGYKIRRAAIDHNIPLITNARLASAFIEAFCSMREEDIQIKSWQEYK